MLRVVGWHFPSSHIDVPERGRGLWELIILPVSLIDGAKAL